MSSGYSDQDRITTVRCPKLEGDFGGDRDVLMLERLVGEEAISRPFRFQLDLISERDNLTFNSIIGQQLWVDVELPDQKKRFFSGIVSRFAQRGEDRRFVSYRAEIVPWFWCLTRISDCRIYQEKTVPEIIQDVFGRRGYTDFQMDAEGQGKRTYCVQYRETDFNFVSRLMEEEGMRYHFLHEEGRHVMVISDKPEYPDNPEVPEVEYVSSTSERTTGEVEDLQLERELAPGKIALSDYNFEQPSEDLGSETSTVEPMGGNEDFEIFDYPGEYLKRNQGSSLAKLRMEAEESAAVQAHGRGELSNMLPGHCSVLKSHYRDDFNGRYLVTEVSHSLSEGAGYDEGGSAYENWFSAVPSDLTYRPPQVTPKPVIQGIQTAKVTGPSGEEIHTDKHGRVKVHFHWDRHGPTDDKSSCWLRVSHSLAGQGWGGIQLPRVGQEVVVEFLEGDPDRPMVTGRVYNGERMPPYALPDEKTVSTLKSRSSKGGGEDNYNEIRFEDKKGSEQLFLRAEKNQDTWVRQRRTEHVGGTTHLTVGGDQMEEVEGEKHVLVKKDHLEEVEGAVSLTIGGDLDEKVGKSWAAAAGQEIHLKAGMTCVIEAGMQLSLKVGGNFIDIGPAGVSISGTMVNINSGGSAGSGKGASPTKPKQATKGKKDGSS